MAIVQASMTEEILSRSEKAVIRGIYRASQLAEAKSALERILMSLQGTGAAKPMTVILEVQVNNLNAYLAQAISSALIATKVPSISQTVKENPSPSA